MSILSIIVSQPVSAPDDRPLIADLVPRLQLRGAEIFAQQLEDELADKYRFRLFSVFADRPAAPFPKEPRDISAGTATSRLNAAIGLRKRVRLFSPNIVVAHGGGPLIAAVLAGLHRMAPLVYVRVTPVQERTRTPFRILALRAAYSRADAVVAVSESLKMELVDEFRVPDRKVTVIRNGRKRAKPLTRDERESLRHSLGISSDDVMVAWVGRFVFQKNPVAAVELAQTLRTRVSNVRFVMVGEGPLEEEARSRVAQTSGIVMTGSRPDAPQIVDAADLLVSTSVFEGLPGVFVESLLAGTPVIAPDIDGVKEAVSAGENGLLAPPGNAAALADLVTQAVRDPNLRARLAEGARRSGDQFDIKTVAEDYDRLYRRMVSYK